MLAPARGIRVHQSESGRARGASDWCSQNVQQPGDGSTQALICSASGYICSGTVG